ncbi:hypothetical protein [Natronoglycomyces albus]|uniref:Uncharacterized protein n=1 Tax=Natronoglycomyces albus TaxID=2811108 RepID=A0A895XMR8_9ACTN|nr:hypothetical protein [Natronoglycomyces albus]QSB06644.1 hypothetical protein JQS30_07045 [Natronoglycomyces albus]
MSTTITTRTKPLHCESDSVRQLETLRDHITVSRASHSLLAQCAGRTVRFRTRPGAFVTSVDILTETGEFNQLGNITNLHKRPYLTFSKRSSVVVLSSQDRLALRATAIAFWCAVQEFSAEIRSESQVAGS